MYTTYYICILYEELTQIIDQREHVHVYYNNLYIHNYMQTIVVQLVNVHCTCIHVHVEEFICSVFIRAGA